MALYDNQDNRQDLIVSYAQMEDLPVFFNEIIDEYANSQTKVTAEYQRKQSRENDEYNVVLKNLNEKRISDRKTADNEYSAVMNRINLTTAKMEQAINEYEVHDSSVKKRKKMDAPLAKVYHAICDTKEKNTNRFSDKISELKNQESTIYQDNCKQIVFEYNSRIEAETAKHTNKLELFEKEYTDNMERIDKDMLSSVDDLNPSQVKSAYEFLQAAAPKIQNFKGAEVMPEAVEIGYSIADLNKFGMNANIDRAILAIEDNFSFALSDNKRHCLLLPCGRSFRDPLFNKLILYKNVSRHDALEYLRALEMRLFMTIPSGKLRVTMIDPVDLGSNFSLFSCLGDQDERIISTKIWSDPDRIKEQLSSLIQQIEHVNQDCLRNDYEDIVIYNRHVGKNAEPLQALFIADFPRHFDKDACELLEKVVSSGPKCGVYTFIAADIDEMNLTRDNFGLDGLFRATEQMVFAGDSIKYARNGQEMYLRPIGLPGKLELDSILATISNGIKNNDRITIYFDEISDNLTKHEERWFNYSEDNGIDIPIGLEGASRTVQIHLGGQSVTSHHALISGNPGAGKSVLLHTIIMSTLLRYSPEDVQIFFLDFKRGVESKVYADADLQNFRVISLDTEPEFGLAVLRYLDEEQAIRSQAFHDVNLQEIEQYSELAENSDGDEIEKFPRILLIIDEFHEMFRNKESEISKECATLLERIVKQGRAFGIHVILASQVLPEELRNIYSLIMNRIALQSTEQTARCILDSDNDGIRSLGKDDSGKGIFNDGGGNRDNNHLFRVAYFDEEEQKEILERIKKRQDKIIGDLGYEKTRLLLSSIQDDNDNPLNYFVEKGSIKDDPRLGCPLYLGEEISMVNTFEIRLMRRRAQNLLIAGVDYNRAYAIYSFSAMSILYNSLRVDPNHTLPEEPVITFFDFSKNRNRGIRRTRDVHDAMVELYSAFPDLIRIFGRDSLKEGIETLNEEMSISNPLRQHYVIFAGLNRAKRLLDSGNAYEKPLKQQLAELIKNGPEAGINYIVWANEPAIFLNYFDDLLQEFDYRIVYDLKEEEYERFIHSTYIDTNYDNNVVFYNPDDENKKIRIYSKPMTSWIKQLIDRLEGGENLDISSDSEDNGSSYNPSSNEDHYEDDFPGESEGEFGGEFDDEFGGEFDDEFSME